MTATEFYKNINNVFNERAEITLKSGFLKIQTTCRFAITNNRLH